MMRAKNNETRLAHRVGARGDAPERRLLLVMTRGVNSLPLSCCFCIIIVASTVVVVVDSFKEEESVASTPPALSLLFSLSLFSMPFRGGIKKEQCSLVEYGFLERMSRCLRSTRRINEDRHQNTVARQKRCRCVMSEKAIFDDLVFGRG